MSIKINLGAWNSVFAVPSKVVDEGLKFADGAKLRVLLYILRNCGESLDEEVISKATNVSITDIPEVLDYWVSMEVLAKSDDTYMPVQSNTSQNIFNNEVNLTSITDNSEKEKSEPDIAEKKEEPKPRVAVSKPQKPDYVFTAQRLAVDDELKFLVEEAQTSLGKVLSNSDIATLLMLKDTCGLPLDVILMVIQYCLSINKGNMRSIEKIGVEWADAGIYSVEAADNRIKQIKQTSKNFSIISSAFGLKNVGSPTKKQLEYGDKWVGEWKFSPQMLREAYERCVDSKGTMSLRYIDGILKRWNSSNIRNLEELQRAESNSSKTPSKSKSSYDIDELEKINTLNNF